MARLFGGRAGRGALFLFLIAGDLGFALVDLLAFGRFDLIIELGFRFDRFGVAPLWYDGLRVLFNLVLVRVAILRLHDIGLSGWWLAAFAGAGLVAVLADSTLLVIALLVAWTALLLWPGPIGPNAFGPDPKGWQSREQYDAQMGELRDQQRIGWRGARAASPPVVQDEA